MCSEGCTTVAADSVSGKFPSLPSESSLLSMQMSFDENDEIDPPVELKIVYQVDDPQAPVSCRTFPDSRTVRESITGFRLVDDGLCGEVAEYRVQLHLDGVCVSAWKRFNEFEQLTMSYLHLAHELNRGPKVEGEEPLTMRNTRRAWLRVQEHRALADAKNSAAVIVKEISYLKILLKHLLFEIPSITHLLRFASCI